MFDTLFDPVFYDLFIDKATNSSDEEYGATDPGKIIEDEFFNSLDLDEEVGIIMLMSMQEEMDR